MTEEKRTVLPVINIIITIIIAIVIVIGIIIIVRPKQCCCPSIEIGIFKPRQGNISHYMPGKFHTMSWTNPLTEFPAQPTEILGSYQQLKPLWPYLPQVEVTNFSNVDVRGATVVFQWFAFGLFDEGIPIGSVAADIPANTTRWVTGPYFITPAGVPHVCFYAHIFHPCDKEYNNNYAHTNYDIVNISSKDSSFSFPFHVGFQQIKGEVLIKVEKPAEIETRIIPTKALPKGGMLVKNELKNIDKLDVSPGFSGEYSLVVFRGERFRKGDAFDVSVSAVQKDNEISKFVIHCVVDTTM